ncbi:hypothetical protein LCGC14_2835230 [marine sediment metagenome]|uniref:Uncharacterized protein n=1 Tax=marine sediment metagenome TaxID=412755 RepID=A0A0F8YD04_9ZZZZ
MGIDLVQWADLGAGTMTVRLNEHEMESLYKSMCSFCQQDYAVIYSDDHRAWVHPYGKGEMGKNVICGADSLRGSFNGY